MRIEMWQQCSERQLKGGRCGKCKVAKVSVSEASADWLLRTGEDILQIIILNLFLYYGNKFLYNLLTMEGELHVRAEELEEELYTILYSLII